MPRPSDESPVYADLHTHTLCSDGTKSPSALVAAADARGLQGLAVTDHDTVAGVAEAQRTAERGPDVIPGVELSAALEDDEVHLLAYGIDPTHEALQDHLQWMRDARRRRAQKMIEQLRGHGLSIPEDALSAQEGGASAVGRPHVAAVLVAEGHVDTTREAFEQYLGRDGLGFVAKPRVPAADVLALVHRVGGIGVLAHPGDWMSSRHLRRLVHAGLDGIEVHHPSHRPSLAMYYRRQADGHDLIVTGGSDYHGRTEREERHFGATGMSEPEWERFRAALA
ncbi:MAG: phosphoesterase [Bacteroidetes bacterium SW_9_63_38]|nr:MAG: phosphoesterase [Bacteroidetes bacterium SW_9_63_38]